MEEEDKHKPFWKGLRTLALTNKKRMKSMPHFGERGRLVEGVVENLIRSILPDKCSIGTGVIINRFDESSPQIDLVIYDRQQNIILKLGNSNLYPIEAVYAAIEVKSVLTGQGLTQAINACTKLRAMVGKGKLYSKFSSERIKGGKGKVVKTRPVKRGLAPRFYLIAFESRLAIEEIKERLAASKDSHFHGIYIFKSDSFLREVPHKKGAFAQPTKSKAFGTLIRSMHRNILSYKMQPAFLDPYLWPEKDEIEE